MFDHDTKFGRTIARRCLFVASLLLIGPVTVSVFHYSQVPNAPGLPPLGVFAWGMDSIGIVLAIWLVIRTGVWRSHGGWVRVAIYVAAYAYGRMLFAATQDWLTASDVTFRFPGQKLEDYARPALDLLSLMMFTWLATPVVIVTQAELSNSHEASELRRRFSISGLIGFTTVASIALCWIRFLTSDFAPQTYYSSMSPPDAIKEWVGTHLPFSIPPLFAALLFLYGLKNSWRVALLFFLFAIALDGLGTNVIASLLQKLTGQPRGGILGGSLADCYLYVCGRSLTVCCAFTAAKMLGVAPVFDARQTRTDAT